MGLKRAALAAIKTFIIVFVFKFVFGIVDVTTDLVNGDNFFNGQFLLGVYFSSKTQEDYLRYQLLLRIF